MKKILTIIFLFTILATSNIFANGTSESATKKEAKKTELLLWLPPFASNSNSDLLDDEFWNQTLQPWADANNVNLEIEITPWSGYEEKYLTAFASGDAPDVGYMYLQMIYDFIDMGTLEDIDKYFTAEDKEDYLYYDKGYMMGGQYSLPFVVGNARVMYANQDILDQAGITELPETWDEFIAACLQIKQNVPDVMPFAQAWANPTIDLVDDNFFPYFWQAGGEIYNEDGTRLTLTDTSAAYDTANFLYDLKNKYNITDDTQLGITSVVSEFKEGNVGFAYMGTFKSDIISEAGVNWTFIPSLKRDKKAIWVASDSLIMNSASEHKELAASLMKYMTTTDTMSKYHRDICAFSPITKTEKYNDDPSFEEMYTYDTQYFKTLPVAKSSAAVFDNLSKNLQLMMMDEITPEEAIDRTVDFAENVL